VTKRSGRSGLGTGGGPAPPPGPGPHTKRDPGSTLVPSNAKDLAAGVEWGHRTAAGGEVGFSRGGRLGVLLWELLPFEMLHPLASAASSEMVQRLPGSGDWGAGAFCCCRRVVHDPPGCEEGGWHGEHRRGCPVFRE